MTTRWKLASALGVAAVLSSGIALSLLLSGSDEAPPTNGTSPAGVGGGPALGTPRRITEGDWQPPGVYHIPTVDRGPVPTEHVGEVINGIRITAPGEGADGICPGKARESDLPFPFEATYLPPNTFEMAKPDVLACPDGRMESAHMSFQIGGQSGLAPGQNGIALFVVNYAALTGPPTASGTGAVSAIEVNGQPAVAVAPEIYEGAEIGQGSVVVDTPNGVIEVVGNTMPLAELVKIAEGLKCSSC